MQTVVLLYLMLLASAAVNAQNWTDKKVWKVAGKSAYSDAPPNLRLQNVQIFYPRTKKLSPVINEMAYKKSPPIEPEDNTPPLSDQAIEDLVSSAFLAQQTITPEERERRNQCQQAQNALQHATQSQNMAQIQEAEADMVQHCVVGAAF